LLQLIGAFFVAVQNCDAAPASQCHANERAILIKTNSKWAPHGTEARCELRRSLGWKGCGIAKNDALATLTAAFRLKM